MKTVITNKQRNTVRKVLYKLDDNFFQMIHDSFLQSSHATVDNLIEIVELINANLLFSQSDLDRLGQSSFPYWKFILKPKYWEERLNSEKLGDKKEAINLLLEIENVKSKDNAKKALKGALKSMDVIKFLENSIKEDTTNEFKSLRSPKEWKRLFEDKNEVQLIEKNLNLMTDLHEFICSGKQKGEHQETQKVDEAVQFVKEFNKILNTKCGFSLTMSQIIAILMLINPDEKSQNVLSQIPTGEGKSLIVAAVAIARAKSNQKVDVITSSSLLAVRDSTMTIKEGGLLEIFQAFGITVAHNCDMSCDKRKQAYSSQVVYGELSSFQRDFLLYKFYNKDILGDRQQQCVIIDEVDCMLLDKGSNILYLSHQIPGLESLESLFVFIWFRVNMPGQSLGDIKSEILFDLFGQIQKHDLSKIHPLLGSSAERDDFWSYLIESKVIDKAGKFLEEKEINYKNKEDLSHKAHAFFSCFQSRKKCINIPSHLHQFVKLHLDNYLNNALTALSLQRDVHYVVDGDRSQQSLDLNHVVTIIDKYTGTDQASSQWDEGLHQFLQLKEGCQITTQMLKAVFVSNITYIKSYKVINGVTGTLGSEPEKEYLKQMFNASFLIVPSAHRKKLKIEPPKLLTASEEWLTSIVNEVKDVIKTRSVIVFCHSIRKVKEISGRIKNDLPDLPPNKFHTYNRDYEKFKFESTDLGPGHVIVATNLAGRGTDIKISSALNEKGGLHLLS